MSSGVELSLALARREAFRSGGWLRCPRGEVNCRTCCPADMPGTVCTSTADLGARVMASDWPTAVGATEAELASGRRDIHIGTSATKTIYGGRSVRETTSDARFRLGSFDHEVGSSRCGNVHDSWQRHCGQPSKSAVGCATWAAFTRGSQFPSSDPHVSVQRAATQSYSKQRFKPSPPPPWP